MTQSKKPSISIIMPCFNASRTLSSTIDRVFAQSFTDFELIIINDGSTDDSLNILNALATKHKSIKVIDQANKGPAIARNKGLKIAKGEFIAFLDADDSWHPDFLEKLYKALTYDQSTAISYCGWQNIGLPPNQCKPFIPPDYETIDKLESLLRSCPWPIHAALTRKLYIDQIEGFNESLTSCMDYDLWLRIASFNKLVLVPEVLAYYHHHDGEQITKNRLKIALNHYRVQSDFVLHNPVIQKQLGIKKISEITKGELKQRAYVSYWQRDLTTSHYLFRKLLIGGYFELSDIKYILLSLLPFGLYKYLIGKLDCYL